ncbi:hypothetical protein CHS0354_036187 [Potamilus streckersoni]|uniref:Uncharacterized protein n=1 Tax=Potamilus streckersoni TaxID=2493646 RepID=A0AAE0SVM0_9BIVA|nr:hypothetical protein CHS0354_036187 [Potamilus streckersoni]
MSGGPFFSFYDKVIQKYGEWKGHMDCPDLWGYVDLIYGATGKKLVMALSLLGDYETLRIQESAISLQAEATLTHPSLELMPYTEK